MDCLASETDVERIKNGRDCIEELGDQRIVIETKGTQIVHLYLYGSDDRLYAFRRLACL